jgi:hypothetical protein
LNLRQRGSVKRGSVQTGSTAATAAAMRSSAARRRAGGAHASIADTIVAQLPMSSATMPTWGRGDVERQDQPLFTATGLFI